MLTGTVRAATGSSKLILAHDYLEGHGDLLWHPDRSRIYAGYGFRSTRGGVEKFAAAMSEMSIPVVPLPLIDSYCYHLDTCLCPLNNDAALIFAGAFSAEALAALHTTSSEFICSMPTRRITSWGTASSSTIATSPLT